MSSKQTTCENCAELTERNAALETRVSWLESQLEIFDQTFAIKQALPTHEEAAKLLRIVTSRYPHMKEQAASEHGQVQNFLCSLAYVWSLTVTKEPVTKFAGSWWIDQATAWCSTARLSGRPRTLLPGIIVSDAPFMLSNDSFFFDPFRSKGTAVDRNAWRKLLSGGELRAATPVKQIVDDRSIGFQKVLAHTW
jgi:hypothetical protein